MKRDRRLNGPYDSWDECDPPQLSCRRKAPLSRKEGDRGAGLDKAAPRIYLPAPTED